MKWIKNRRSWLVIGIVIFLVSLLLFGRKIYFEGFIINTSSIKFWMRSEVDGTVVLNSDTYFEDKTTGIFYTYQEYLDFLKSYEVDNSNKIDKKSFERYNYVWAYLEINNCSEEIKAIDVIFEDKVATMVFAVGVKCGNCNIRRSVYLIPVAKNRVISKIQKEYQFVQLEDCSSLGNILVVDKPILYLYPEEDVNVDVQLKYKERLIATYPKYQNGWKVLAKPNGDLYDMAGNYYYALYWDEKDKSDVDFSYGFYVTKEDAIPFLEEKLSIIGLNNRERNEFIMYWLPKLESNGQSLVYFELTEEREKNNPLLINPKPDSLLRVNMHIKKVSRKVNILEQELSSFERDGFVAVEWGGTIHS